MNSDFTGPVNIGSEEMVTIEELAKKVIKISGKKVNIKYVSGPQGVRGRNSDNNLIEKKINWKPSSLLSDGLDTTYKWISGEISKKNK